MQYIVWDLMYLMEIEYVQVLLIKLQKYGIQSLENYYQRIQDIKVKSLQFHSILMDYWLQLGLWTVLLSFGMFKWVKYTQL